MHRDTAIVQEAIKIQAEYLQFRNKEFGDRDYRSDADKARAAAALEKFRLIGSTAAFFGGYEGMLALNNAIVEAGGDSRYANYMWDGIAGWLP